MPEEVDAGRPFTAKDQPVMFVDVTAERVNGHMRRKPVRAIRPQNQVAMVPFYLGAAATDEMHMVKAVSAGSASRAPFGAHPGVAKEKHAKADVGDQVKMAGLLLLRKDDGERITVIGRSDRKPRGD